MTGITSAPTSIVAFIGSANTGPFDSPVEVTSFAAYEAAFGPLDAGCELGFAVYQFFLDGGGQCYVVRVLGISAQSLNTLDAAPLFNLLCLPGVYDTAILSAAAQYCEQRRAFLIADCDPGSSTPAAPAVGANSGSVAVYGPWLRIPDPLKPGQTRTVAPSGSVAGVMARTDTGRGVWVSPAGLSATVTGLGGVAFSLTDAQSAELTAAGVNPIREFPAAGIVIWGARTLAGAGSQYEYVPVRRLLLFIEQSILNGTEWVRFESNTPQLWANVRNMVNQFLTGLYRQGAFHGATPNQALFVRCDSSTMTQQDIQDGRLIMQIGVAPLQPAEFVIFTIQQMTAGV